ncbi:protein of unknown function [Nitratireductor aquimarinus]
MLWYVLELSSDPGERIRLSVAQTSELGDLQEDIRTFVLQLPHPPRYPQEVIAKEISNELNFFIKRRWLLRHNKLRLHIPPNRVCQITF